MYCGAVICACEGGTHGAVGEIFVLNLVVLSKIMPQDVFQPHLISFFFFFANSSLFPLIHIYPQVIPMKSLQLSEIFHTWQKKKAAHILCHFRNNVWHRMVIILKPCQKKYNRARVLLNNYII